MITTNDETCTYCKKDGAVVSHFDGTRRIHRCMDCLTNPPETPAKRLRREIEEFIAQGLPSLVP